MSVSKPIPDGKVTIFLKRPMPHPLTTYISNPLVFEFRYMSRGWVEAEDGSIRVTTNTGWYCIDGRNILGYEVTSNTKDYLKHLELFQVDCTHEWEDLEIPVDELGQQAGDAYSKCLLCHVDSRKLPDLLNKFDSKEEH